ncbi:MAG: zinc-ribbon domain-containing protein, partial [Deltaproteobacteria bacterium]|nr:zinc-ribbon domain-containing protein [Deltaproteobacteria bacterium]
MIVQCGTCQSKYQLDPKKVSAQATSFKCPKCGQIIVVSNQTLSASAMEPRITVDLDQKIRELERRLSDDARGMNHDEIHPALREPSSVLDFTLLYRDDQGLSLPVINADVRIPSVDNPVFTPAPGRYDSQLSIAVTCTTRGANIYYTTDGSDPTERSPLYTGRIEITESTTIKARAFKIRLLSSELMVGDFQISQTVQEPYFSPPPGTFWEVQAVFLTCPTPGAEIRFTTDDSKPSHDSQKYIRPIYIDRSTTIKARAFKPEREPSEIVSAFYEFTGQVQTPGCTLAPGLYTGEQVLTLTCATPGAEIRYTLDGQQPDENSPLYTGPLEIRSSIILSAKAFKPGWAPSEWVQGDYVITGQVAAPVLSPSPGRYDSRQILTLSCETPEAEIRYTVNGRQPEENSPIYSKPLSIHSSVILLVRAFRFAWEPSEVVRGEYLFTAQVATPVYSLSPGTYVGRQILRLTCATPEAEIRFTTDGRETDQTSWIYSGPLEIKESTKVWAKAFKPGWDPSETVRSEYIITGQVAVPTWLPAPGTYTKPQILSLNCSTPESEIRFTIDGSEPDQTSQIYRGPLNTKETTTVWAKAFRPGWEPSETIRGEYIITGKVATPAWSPTPGTYTTPQVLTLTCSTPESEIRFTIDGSEPDQTSEIYVEPLEIKESATVWAKAFRPDWEPSETVRGEYIITGKVATPVWSLPPGTYTTPQVLTLTCATYETEI